ncbi:MAG: hypothetical protein K2X71_20295 [Methylobacterium sp.]|uniref:hypothetical protein n=1 Tax=Methylobacterium sp. TaxID=409 RepID=UPI002582F401|nr:hypothetical protein [Methylobacterium sp.]MBY0298344.1 hypothetical protein [Methylobacterium sp.]
MRPLDGDQFTVVRTTTEIAAVRVKAVAEARHLRALAVIALRDGMPHAETRAANARAAARSVLGFARRLTAEARARAALCAADPSPLPETCPAPALEPA